MKYCFKDEEFDTYEEAVLAVEEYVYENFDEFIDEVNEEAVVMGYSFRASIVLKYADPILYRMMRDEYIDDYKKQIEEIEDDEYNEDDEDEENEE